MQSLNQNGAIDYLLLYKTNQNLAKKLVEKADLFMQALQMPELNLQVIQSIAFHGIPDEIKGLRALIWRILLCYLPKDKNKWSSLLEQNHKNYELFIQDFLVIKNKENLNINKTKAQEEKNKIEFISVKDHPLNKAKESDWNTLFKDLELWDEIEKDTKRTRSEISFFLDKTNPPSNYPILSRYVKKDPRFTSKTEQFHKINQEERPEVQHDVMTRILFLYAKLNPGVRYVQGMNEILAPIYYCFSHDQNPFFQKYIESDSFFCFSILMGEIKDGFLRSLDNSISGIKFRIQSFSETLQKIDPDVWQHLEEQKVHPQYYSLRWLMLLLTQEFQISDVLRLWDSLLSHPNKMEYLYYLCISIVLSSKEKILSEEFSGIMETLQNTDSYDVNKFLVLANKLYKDNCDNKE